jgi:hypothetical protein
MRSGFDAMTIAEAIYLLCAATSLLAAILLVRQYAASRTPLLLWSFLGFIGLAINNVLIYIDLVVVPNMNLAPVRALTGALGVAVILYGLIWETR